MNALRFLEINIYSIFMYAHIYPIFFYQVVVLARFPTAGGLAMLGVGAVVSAILCAVLLARDALQRQHSLITGWLDRASECRYKRYRVSDYIERETLELAEGFSTQGVLSRAGFSAKLNEHVHIWIVQKGPIPRQLGAYSLAFIDSFILARDGPDIIKNVSRFFIHHEIGHTLLTAQISRVRLMIGSVPFMILAFWAIWSLKWNAQSAAAFSLLILIIIPLEQEWFRRRDEMRLEDEVAADHFAIQTLPGEELPTVERYFLRNPPWDNSLSTRQNVERIFYLQNNFYHMREGGVEAMLLISDSRRPLEIYPAVAVVALLATFARTPTVDFAIKCLLYIGSPMLIYLIVLTAIAALLRRSIEATLSERLVEVDGA